MLPGGMLPGENVNFRPNIRNAGFWHSGRLFGLGSESNDDGNGNENGKKALGLDWQNNKFVRTSCSSVHFFAVTARL